MYKELVAELRDYDGPVIYEDTDGQHVERTAVDLARRAADAIDKLCQMLSNVHPYIKCRDCRWDKPDKMLNKHWCTRFWGAMEVREDDFCSYGRKKEADGNV